MKTSLTLFVALMLLAITPYKTTAKTFEGYVVTINNDTIKGQVHVSTPTVNELKIRFTNENNKTTTYTPSDLNGYAFLIPQYDQTGNRTMEWIHFLKRTVAQGPMKLSDNSVFVEVRILGKVVLFDFYTEENSRIGQEVKHTYYVEREGGVNFQMLSRENYKQVLGTMLNDFSTLAEKIGTTGFGYKYIPSMVKAYNEYHRQKCLGISDPLITMAFQE